ncbi:DUF317 domain-containing protein [Streptomyces sp. NPDC059176]|uniref:DUF317 domain-containing protein n=1 Tax=Streptomyces sp. NPDC059176 TaxID=3346758 RepID=UPI0036AA840F
MAETPSRTHVRFALHSDHPPAVTATVTGPASADARILLTARGFRDSSEQTMVLARIDHEEPYYAQQASETLTHRFDIKIDPALREAIDTDRDWADYPLPDATREELRMHGATAQQIHDDIASGRLTIHLHALDGRNTAAVGSYTDGRHVHLRGQDHLRDFALVFTDATNAVAEFHRLYSVAVRPGPAPLTSTERTIAELTATATRGTQPSAPAENTRQPVHTASTARTCSPEEHEALLESFLEANSDWEKVRTWSDETTVASHESLTIRAEFDHEARHRTDTAWPVAEYYGPVGERIWHATLTAGTPVPLVRALLQHLDHPAPTDASRPYEPLRDAGWQPSSHPARTARHAPDRTIAFEHTPHAADDRWTLFGGEDLNHAAWAIHLSAGVGHDVLAYLASAVTELSTPQPAAVRRPSSGLPVPTTIPQHRGRLR